MKCRFCGTKMKPMNYDSSYEGFTTSLVYVNFQMYGIVACEKCGYVSLSLKDENNVNSSSAKDDR